MNMAIPFPVMLPGNAGAATQNKGISGGKGQTFNQAMETAISGQEHPDIPEEGIIDSSQGLFPLAAQPYLAVLPVTEPAVVITDAVAQLPENGEQPILDSVAAASQSEPKAEAALNAAAKMAATGQAGLIQTAVMPGATPVNTTEANLAAVNAAGAVLSNRQSSGKEAVKPGVEGVKLDVEATAETTAADGLAAVKTDAKSAKAVNPSVHSLVKEESVPASQAQKNSAAAVTPQPQSAQDMAQMTAVTKDNSSAKEEALWKAVPKTAVSSNETTTVSGQGKTELPQNAESELPKNVFSELLQQRTLHTDSKPSVGAAEAKSAAADFVKDTHNITTQIVDQARLLKNNQETQMIIRLKPEHLGELTLKIAVDKGIINASFHSDNPEVRTVLESSLQQLKQELSGQGLKVDNVGVYAGLGQFLSNSQRETPQQPVIKLKSRQAEEEAFEEAEKLAANQAVSDTGVDYRI